MQIKMGRKSFSVRENVKYLGMNLDKKLLWKKHIESCVAKCEKSLNVLKYTMRKKYGADPKTALTFYRAYTRSIIDYGSILYGAAANIHLKKLDTLQYKALRMVHGAIKSTPVENLLSLSNEPPLTLRRLLLAGKYLAKATDQEHSLNHQKISTLTRYVLTNQFWNRKNTPPLVEAYIEIAEFCPNRRPSSSVFSHPFEHYLWCSEVIIPPYSDIPAVAKTQFQAIVNSYPNALHIYTDGSKSEKGVGSAVYCPKIKHHQKYKLSEHASIYTAEATAVEGALALALTTATESTLLIMTDSKAVLEAIRHSQGHIYNNPLVSSIISKQRELDNLGRKTVFVWVKGHSIFSGNNIADQLAREAAQNGEQCKWILNADITAKIKQICHNRWQRDWCLAGQQKRLQAYRVYPKVMSLKIFQMGNIPRYLYVALFRTIVGHGAFKKRLHKMGLVDSPLCECDGESDCDLNHIYFKCEKYGAHRNQLLDSLRTRKVNLPLNVETLLYIACKNLDVLNLVSKFIKDAKIYAVI